MGKKRSPRGRTEALFEAIRNAGFHPIDVKYENGYFIFEHGKDMVIHFHIKELKGWLFGIWWDVGGELKYDFFGQFEREINKFKPSASTFVEENIPYEDGRFGWQLRGYILPILKFIKKYPYIAWDADCGYPEKLQDLVEYGRFESWWRYVKYTWKYYKWYPFLNARLTKAYRKAAELVCEDKLVDYRFTSHNNIISHKGFKVDNPTKCGWYALVKEDEKLTGKSARAWAKVCRMAKKKRYQALASAYMYNSVDWLWNNDEKKYFPTLPFVLLKSKETENEKLKKGQKK